MKKTLIAWGASRPGIIVTGAVIGVIAALLQYLGNPPNMGVCVACFERDIAGALGLHRAGVVQYLRPEIPAFVLGSMLAAFLFGEWRSRGGSSPLVRFVLGAFAMIGALAFLGCPWRALFRLGGGDLNAIVGLAGLASGIFAGVLFLKRGYTLGRASTDRPAAGALFPVLMIGLLLLAVLTPGFLLASEKGPGKMHAALGLSIGAGLLIGVLAQRTRFCTMGAFRDFLLMRETHLLSGVGALVIAVIALNLVLGSFSLGFELQPIGHSDHLWNFLGMVLAGLCFCLAGGCPGRQLFLAGEGDADAAVFATGMIVGAAFAHNFKLAAVPDKMVNDVLSVGGPGPNGQVAVVVGLVLCGALGLLMREKWETAS